MGGKHGVVGESGVSVVGWRDDSEGWMILNTSLHNLTSPQRSLRSMENFIHTLSCPALGIVTTALLHLIDSVGRPW